MLPWREWDGDLGPEAELVFVRDGTRTGEAEALAQVLRNDGVANNLYEAFTMAERAEYAHSFYGFVDGDRTPIVCNERGETDLGDIVKRPWPCIFALIEVP